MSEVTVSVVLTTYNGEKHLAKQIDSIVRQTYRALEIIICDDQSSDQTRQIIEQYAAADSRIICMFQQVNLGLHANLETGLRRATGDYIAISDQDDIWREDKIEKLLKHVEHHAACFSDSQLIDADDNQLGITILQAINIRDVKSALSTLNLVRQNAVSGHAMLFRKSLLDYALPLSLELIFDHHLAIIASMHGGIAYYPEPLVQHRIHGSNHTNSEILNKEIKASESFSYKKLTQPWDYYLDHRASSALKNRVLRRRRSHDFLYERLMTILSSADGKESIDNEIVQHLYQIADAMSSNRHRYFDMGVYLALRDFDKKYDFFGIKKRIKLSKGALWYRSADKIGMR